MAGPPRPIDYVARWRRIVAARRAQHDAACAAEGRSTADYWARRAAGYHKFAREASAGKEPFLEALLRHLRPGDTVLDVGAGTGRHAVPLARYAKRVVALDPSAAMLGFLWKDAAAQGLSNIEIIEGAWPEAESKAPEADIVISAHVLYPIEDVVAFLHALDRHARRLCFLNLMVWQPWFDQIGLWEAVHGEPRLPQPTYIDALSVLHQLGCYANAEIAWVETKRAFESLDEAVDRFAETVAVGSDGERLRRLREVLAEKLTPLPDGRLAFPTGRYPIATVWWEAGTLRMAQAG